MTEFPPGVLESLRNKESVLFIGSGFSIAAGYPSSTSIAMFLANELRRDGKAIDPASGKQLDKTAVLYEKYYGRPRLLSVMESFLKTSPRDVISPSHRLLASLVKHGFVRCIITTNYDTLIEDACSVVGTNLRVVAHESQLYAAAGDHPVLYKIHGDFSHPERLVLTPLDYARWSNEPDPRSIKAQLRALFDRSALLFLGYSLSDYNVCSLLLGSDFASRGALQHKRFAAIYSREFEEATAQIEPYGVEGFACPEVEELLRMLLLNLPVTLRIKHLVFNYPSWYPDQQSRYGGIETFIEHLRRHAKNCSHETYQTIYGAMLRFNPRLSFSRPAYPASFFFFRAAAKAALESSLHLSSTSDGDRPDVVHVHFLDFAHLAEQAEIPTLCTSHSLLSRDLAFTTGIFDGQHTAGALEEVRQAYAAEREAAVTARFITVISKDHEAEIRGLGARSVRRVEAPFDAAEFLVETSESARSRAYPALNNKFTIGYIGRPDRRKGIEVLIKACELLAGGQADFQLLLVGYGFSQGDKSLDFDTGWFSFDISGLRAAGIAIHLRRASGTKDVGVFYSQADVVVVPSLYEPMGYVVLEAMACERPVVASRTGGIPEAITDGVNGLLFEPGDAKELAEKLATLYHDAGLRQRLGRKARIDVEGRRPAAEVVLDWEDLYRQAAFAFGSPLFPPPSLVKTIRERCEKKIAEFSYRAGFDVYNTAMLGCEIAQELNQEAGEELKLPHGVPVDRALQSAIAVEFQKALRRKGVEATFSIATLTDVMNDLALARLNETGHQRNIRLNASKTKRRLSHSWFEESIRHN